MKRALGLVLFLLAACTSTNTITSTPPAAAPAAAREPVHLVIVGTTDVHGWFAGHDEKTKQGQNVGYGGVAVLASYVDALRAANPGRVVVVDSGDLFQGTLESNLFEGEPVVKGYNAVGYAAAAVGNHEFDFGPVGPKAVPQAPADDPLGALKKNASLMTFPWLSANLTEKASGKTPSWCKPSIIVTSGGVKLGIIGLSTPDTPNVTMPANVTTLDFGDPVPPTIREAANLRAQGADAVIVIAHVGGRCTDMNDVHDVASCEPQQAVMKYLQALPAGTIDAYFAGHTHAQMRQVINGIATVQSGAYSREFSTVDLWVDPSSHRVTRSELRKPTMICAAVWSGTESCDPRNQPAGATLVPRTFEGVTIAPKTDVAAIFQPYLQQVAAKRNEPLGVRTTARIARAYTKESQLGDLLADLLREGTGVDIAFVNAGGIRTDIKSGELTYSDIFEVSPFDNFPAVVPMTGAQITEVLRGNAGSDRGILLPSGIRYTVDLARTGDKLVGVTLENGQPLDPNATYRVAIPDFLAAGGDGWAGVMKQIGADRVKTDTTAPIRELIVAMLKKRGATTAGVIEPPPLGRITVLNAPKGGD